MRRVLTITAALFATALLVGACSNDDGGTVREADTESDSDADSGSDSGSASGSGSGSASGTGSEAASGEDFCTVVEDNITAAIDEDLLAAIEAIETMAAAAPGDLRDAFEANLAALEPVRAASTPEEANQIFIDEVIVEPDYVDTFTAVEDGVEEECGFVISDIEVD